MTEPTSNIAKPKVSYKDFKIKDINLDSNDIESLEVFESLTYPGITGKISLRDWHDIKATHNFFPYDSLSIEAGWKEFILKLDPEKFVITGSYNDHPDPNQPYKLTNFNFESKWSVDAFTKKISKQWRGKRIDEIITDLVTICGGEMGIVIPTEGKLDRFFSPKWTVMNTFKYLMSFAMSDKTIHKNRSNGAYCLWTDLTSGKVNFAPMDYLFFNGEVVLNKEQEIVNASESNTPYGSTFSGYNSDDATTLNPANTPAIKGEKTVLTFDGVNEHSFRKIEEISVERTYDVMRFVDSGGNASALVGFDYDNYKPFVEELTINKFGEEHNHLSTSYPLPIKFIGSVSQKTDTEGVVLRQNQEEKDVDTFEVFNNDYKTTKFTSLYPNTEQLMVDEIADDSDEHHYTSNLHIKGRLRTRMANLMADVVKINLATGGDPLSKKVGRKVIVYVPSSGKGGEKLNKQLSGTYVVRNNKHSLVGGYYINTLTVMADGLKKYDTKEPPTTIKSNANTLAANVTETDQVKTEIDNSPTDYNAKTPGEEADGIEAVVPVQDNIRKRVT